MSDDNDKPSDSKRVTISLASADKTARREQRRVRRVNPLGMRVVVRIRDDNDMTEGGLYLPEGAKQSMHESYLCEVIEVASAHESDSDEETNVSGIPLGATVLVPKHAGTKIPWDERLRIVDTKEVLAIVEEIALS